MIDDLIGDNLGALKQLAGNVWKFTSKGHDYAVKAEKKNFLDGLNLQPTDPNSLRNRLNDLEWAIELFLVVTAKAAYPTWARALRPREVQSLYSRLPKANVWSKAEWCQTPMQVADFVRNLACFYDAKGTDQKATEKKSILRQILLKKSALIDLGRGLAVDIFLGNTDRFTLDTASNEFFINLDNFFFTVGVNRKEIVYLDYWDPNSSDNSKDLFKTPSGSYLGQYLGSSSNRLRLAMELCNKMQKQLSLNARAKTIEEGMKEGTKLLKQHLKKTNNPSIKRRLAVCKL